MQKYLFRINSMKYELTVDDLFEFGLVLVALAVVGHRRDGEEDAWLDLTEPVYYRLRFKLSLLLKKMFICQK